jgi:hypothetical protein
MPSTTEKYRRAEMATMSTDKDALKNYLQAIQNAVTELHSGTDEKNAAVGRLMQLFIDSLDFNGLGRYTSGLLDGLSMAGASAEVKKPFEDLLPLI